MNIKCLIGFHDWSYWEKLEENFKRRFCKRCNRKQKETYDMSYGETYWADDNE